MMIQRAVTTKVGRNKSSQFRHEPNVTLLPEQHTALFRPTATLPTARLVGVAALLLAGCNASAPVPVAPAPVAPSNVQVESSSPTEVAFYLPGMNASMQIL